MADLLRPKQWSDYIGQTKLKADLEIRIAAALYEARPLEHLLFYGPPGSGKTSLANIIATEMNEPLETLIMPVTMKTLSRMLTDFEGVLVLEELHAASNALMEALQPVLEFGYWQEPDGRRIDVGYLTILATTTKRNLIIEPLRDRFEIPDIDPYTDAEMTQIVLGMAAKADIFTMDVETAFMFGQAACGTPRRALKFVHGYKRLGIFAGTTPTAAAVLEMMRTDHDGLTVDHVRYLEILDALHGARGLKTLASLMRLDVASVEELERLLITKNLVELTDGGRLPTRAGTRRARGVADDSDSSSRRERMVAA